jgi:hypothetical protein
MNIAYILMTHVLSLLSTMLTCGPPRCLMLQCGHRRIISLSAVQNPMCLFVDTKLRGQIQLPSQMHGPTVSPILRLRVVGVTKTIVSFQPHS